MDKRSRRQFWREFNAETVALMRSSAKPVAQVCRDMDLSESTVRRWVAQAEVDNGQRDRQTNGRT